jgi:hypothetical protein
MAASCAAETAYVRLSTQGCPVNRPGAFPVENFSAALSICRTVVIFTPIIDENLPSESTHSLMASFTVVINSPAQIDQKSHSLR